jgi:hypothetical protein
MDEIKKIFMDLASVDFLKRCVRGETQKPNESSNCYLDEDTQNCFCMA